MNVDLTLNGVKMRPVFTDASGVVSGETELIFEQVGDYFSARYQGGTIVDGYLIGNFLQNGSIEFRYVQVDSQGSLDCGVSTGRLSQLQDGRLRLDEKFQWLTRPGAGTNAFEELVDYRFSSSGDKG